MRKAAGRGWQPKFGVLEFFAQEHSFHWEEDGVYINEKLIWPPLILKKNNASMVHAGEQVGSGPLTGTSWYAMQHAPRCVIVWFLEVIDSCCYDFPRRFSDRQGTSPYEMFCIGIA